MIFGAELTTSRQRLQSDPCLPNKPLMFVARTAECVRFTARGNRHACPKIGVLGPPA
jgi:hypothetical protein